MKKFLPLLLLSLTLGSQAQISLENHYLVNNPVSISFNKLRLVNLSASGYKYFNHDQNSITLYNLNHTVFKTITIPPPNGTLTCSNCNFTVKYVSETLFDTDSSTVEYFVHYDIQVNNQTVGVARVYDEFGNTLLSIDSVVYDNVDDFVVYTPSGYKMILIARIGNGSYLYSLPGTLPCNDCTNGTTTGRREITDGLGQGNISSYPNPNNGLTTVEYTLPKGSTMADLLFYDMRGQEVKRYKVTNDFHDIVVSTEDLQSGTYYYQIQTADGFKMGKKMIVIK